MRRKLKLLLVHPPSFHMADMPGPSMVFRASFYAPLGLLYVGTYAMTRRDCEVRFFDYEASARRIEDIVPLVREFEPDVLGITGYTFDFYDSVLVCRAAKAAAPGLRVVMGGPHVDVYPEETLTHPEIDVLVQGEGEETMLELIDHWRGERDLADVRGIYYRAPDGGVVWTGERPRIPNIDAIPFPDRTLFEDRGYRTIVNPNFREASMVTSRGCPYKCNFCNVFEKRYRYRSAQNVAGEMSYLQGLGYDYIHFYDDTFNLFNRKVTDLCRAYLDAGLRVQWAFRGRVDHIDEEMVDLLRRANCRRIYFGVEAGTEEVLQTIGKRITLEQARRAFRLARSSGIEVLGYFMLGFPDETPEQMEETIRTAIELDPHYVQVLVTTPLPGTPLYRQAIEEGGIPGDYVRDYVLRPTPTLHMRPWNRRLNEQELIARSKRFYRKFYFRPRYMARRLGEISSARELAGKAAAAMSLLGFQFTSLLPKES